VRKEDLWEIYDRWNGKLCKPDNKIHFHNLKDALDKVEGFARDLESDVSITLENDGTYRFFGNGEGIIRWKG